MNYQEHLNTIDWKNKRTTILKRDKNKCQNCFNQSYQKFESGLIFGNEVSHNTSKTTLQKEKFIVCIWNLKKGLLEKGFINDHNFNFKKSNIAFYEKKGDYAQIIALKPIENSLLKLNSTVEMVLNGGIEWKVKEETFDIIYAPIQKEDIWNLIYGLHIHHKYYQEGLMAWEYPDEALVALCWECHEKLHKETTVPILDIQGNEIGEYTNCKRCHGAGIFPEYYHVEYGICFRCGGKKIEELI